MMAYARFVWSLETFMVPKTFINYCHDDFAAAYDRWIFGL